MALKLTAEGLTKMLKNCKNFDKVLEKVNIVKLENGRCLAEIKISEEHTNTFGTLHGGYSATLVDCISTYALMSTPNGEYPNVSVDIHMTYLKSGKLGSEILIDATTTRAGRTLAFLNVFIKDKATGDVLVHGTHTKYIMQPKE